MVFAQIIIKLGQFVQHFIVIFNYVFSATQGYIASTKRVNLKACGRTRSWPNLRYYPGTYLEGLRNSTKILSQDSRPLGRDFNPGALEYEAEVLNIRPRRSVQKLFRRKINSDTILQANISAQATRNATKICCRYVIQVSRGPYPPSMLTLQVLRPVKCDTQFSVRTRLGAGCVKGDLLRWTSSWEASSRVVPRTDCPHAGMTIDPPSSQQGRTDNTSHSNLHTPLTQNLLLK
jgi:hypothetical protein